MDEYFMREGEVAKISGLSRTTRWRLEREGKFPKRRQISSNTVGWLSSEISAWVAERVGESAKAA
jgi:prophage regulatory protein